MENLERISLCISQIKDQNRDHEALSNDRARNLTGRKENYYLRDLPKSTIVCGKWNYR